MKAETQLAAASAFYFFKNPTFEMLFLTSLGRAYHSGGDVGKVLYLTRQSRLLVESRCIEFHAYYVSHELPTYGMRKVTAAHMFDCVLCGPTDYESFQPTTANAIESRI
jgi:hypothetical protein